MKTLTPQILALYLGCECLYTDEDMNTMIATLLAVNLQGYAWFVNPEFDEAIGIQSVMPILRPLSSMSEVEAQQLLAILFLDMAQSSEDRVTADEIDVDLHPHDDGSMVDRDMAVVVEVSCRCFEGQLGVTLNGSLVLYDESGNVARLDNTAEAFTYLLSKSFDLFNLIPEGLAIDKTTLNQ